jgi:hypothetical protein
VSALKQIPSPFNKEIIDFLDQSNFRQQISSVLFARIRLDEQSVRSVIEGAGIV